MIKLKYSLSLLMLFMIILSVSHIQADEASQNLSITVEAINELSVNSDSLEIHVNADSAEVSAGDDSFTVIDETTSMSYTTNQENMSIIAILDNDFSNIDIAANIAPNSNTDVEYTTGTIGLSSTTGREIITNINNASDSDMTIKYEITVYPTTPNVIQEQNTVTFTLTDQ